MARVLNLIRRSEAEFVIEEEVQPGEWISVTHVPQAAVTVEKPRQAFVTPEGVANFLDSLGSFFRGRNAAAAAVVRPPAAVRPPEPVVEFVPPPARPLVQGPVVQQGKLAVTPEQITRLITETKIREQAIKQFVATPIGFVWQESKKLPNYLERIPVKRPIPTPHEILERFPLPRLEPPGGQQAEPPAPVRVFKGFIELAESGPLGPKGKRVNLWEDFAGNEIEGFREERGEFGQVEQILEY